MWQWTLIAIGGAAGTLARYALGGLVQRNFGTRFPYGTLLINVIGCLFIGLLGGGFFSSRRALPPEIRIMLMIGLLGGFTTFSSFGYETFNLLNDRQWLRAGMNILLSNGLGLLAVMLGYRLAERGL